MYLTVQAAEFQGQREYQEDRHCMIEDLIDGWAMFAVFDGHGNDYVSHFLKFHFKDILRECILQRPTEIEGAVFDAFKKINVHLDREKAMNSGSTVCAVLAKGDQAIFINTGDSRVVMSDGDGAIVFESLDHKPNRPDEIERIHESGGFVFPIMGVYRVNGQYAVSRAVGDFAQFPYIVNTPEVGRKKIPESAYIILATDGIWDVTKSEEAATLVANHNATAGALIARASSAGSGDNMTVIIIKAESMLRI
jgi:serine/threonine protein phosphatase PrpC